MTIDFKDNDGLQNLVTSDFGDWSSSFTIDQQLISDFAEIPVMICGCMSTKSDVRKKALRLHHCPWFFDPVTAAENAE